MGIQSKLNKLKKQYEENNNKGPIQIKAIKSNELYQQLQEAKDRQEYAPTAVEVAERESYTFKHGTVAYDHYLKKKYEREAKQLEKSIQMNHTNVIENTLEKLHYYESQHIYYKNMHQITETLMKQILQFMNQIKYGLSVDSTQQRETYYKDLQRMSMEDYILLFQFIVIGFMVIQVLQFTEYKYILLGTILVFILLRPFITKRIIYPRITPHTVISPTIYTENDNRVVYRGQSNIA